MFKWALLTIGSLILFLKTNRDATPMKPVKSNFDPIYRRHATPNGLMPSLLKAIAFVESSENPMAVNKSDPSYGLMQILCTGKGAMCENRFILPGWPVTRDSLLDPELNVSLGAQILGWNVSQYGLLKGIAVYNNWSARSAPREGPFPNQSYVDKVMAAKRDIEEGKLV